MNLTGISSLGSGNGYMNKVRTPGCWMDGWMYGYELDTWAVGHRVTM